MTSKYISSKKNIIIYVYRKIQIRFFTYKTNLNEGVTRTLGYNRNMFDGDLKLRQLDSIMAEIGENMLSLDGSEII
jgi:hypothetical protein